MNSDVAYELIKTCLTTAFMVAAPMVILCLVTGIMISLFQTITTIQEQTLTFLPKLCMVSGCLWLLSPWMIQKLGDLVVLFFQRAGEIAR